MSLAPPTTAPATSVIRNRPLITLFLGHMTIDLYAGLLPVLFPVLSRDYDLDLATVGLVALAYSGVGSVSQPLFGWLADRYGTRLTGVALVWTAVTFAAIAVAPSFWMIVALAGAAGLGSGAFHPFGALNANAVIDDRRRNSAMSVYASGGTVGFAVGPLIGVGLLALFGIRGIGLMVVPGTLIAVWLLLEMRRIAVQGTGSRRGRAGLPPIPWLLLAAVIIVMMARSWTMSSMQAFIPTWYDDMGYSEAFYGFLATTITLASALGTLGSGSLADRHGRRALIVGSLVATIPAILLFTQSTGSIAFVTGALVGILAASTAPLLLVMAQQLMQGRAGVASGLILGLGFVTGAIGVPVTGAIADAFSIQTAMRAQSIVILLAIPIALLLPNEARMRQIQERGSDRP
ncbi:MAG TPA: MFS transporter [Thermomicrobiales bacterium]|nr:MFS transporter [Thermomicrobiales bacterium]